MSILLMILKILGIILLVLVLLVLFLVVFILASPIRYESVGNAGPEHIRIRLKVSWLLKIIKVNGSVSDDRIQLEVRALWFRILRKAIPWQYPLAARFAENTKAAESTGAEDSTGTAASGETETSCESAASAKTEASCEPAASGETETSCEPAASGEPVASGEAAATEKDGQMETDAEAEDRRENKTESPEPASSSAVTAKTDPEPADTEDDNEFEDYILPDEILKKFGNDQTVSKPHYIESPSDPETNRDVSAPKACVTPPDTGAEINESIIVTPDTGTETAESIIVTSDTGTETAESITIAPDTGTETAESIIIAPDTGMENTEEDPLTSVIKQNSEEKGVKPAEIVPKETVPKETETTGNGSDSKKEKKKKKPKKESAHISPEDRWNSLRQKYEEIRLKIQKVRDFLEDPSVWKTAGLVRRCLFRILKDIRPRTMRIHGIFGTGDPALDGQILGIFYMGYPIYGNHGDYRLSSDFQSKTLKGKYYLNGRIILAVPAFCALRLIADKNIRRLIFRK